MHKSKLLTLFYALSKKERLAFRKFIHSPFWNKREEVKRFYAYLETASKKKKPNWKKEEVFKHLFPGLAYDEIQMRHLMSTTFKLMEDFLSIEGEEYQAIRQKINLARVYRKRQLYKFFEQTVKTAELLLEKMPKDFQYFHFQYLLEFESYQFIKSRKRIAEYNLQELMTAVDVRFLTNKLKQSCSLLSHQAVYNIDYDAGLLPTVIDSIEDSVYLKIPAISIYYHCYLALTQDDDEQFRLFKEQIFDLGNQFSPDELRDLYLHAINFCIKKLNTGQEQYVKEAFELYKTGLESEVLLEQKRLSRFAYKNVVALGLRLEAFDWITYFLENYTRFLEQKFKANYYNYNYARMAFVQKKYDQAMKALAKVGSSDLLLNIDGKVMLLKMYYELDEFDALEALVSSMQTFMRRKGMLAYHRENYFNILKYVQRMISLNPVDKKSKAALIQEIEKQEVLTEKPWLLKQLQK